MYLSEHCEVKTIYYENFIEFQKHSKEMQDNGWKAVESSEISIDISGKIQTGILGNAFGWVKYERDINI